MLNTKKHTFLVGLMGFVDGLLLKNQILFLLLCVKNNIEIYNTFDTFFMFYIRGPPYYFQNEKRK